MRDPNKIITVSEEAFMDVTTDIAAEISAHLSDPTVPLVLALFCAKLTARLFEDADELNIEDNK